MGQLFYWKTFSWRENTWKQNTAPCTKQGNWWQSASSKCCY